MIILLLKYIFREGIFSENLGILESCYFLEFWVYFDLGFLGNVLKFCR